MFISNIKIQNFRLIKSATLNLDSEKKKDLALLIGRNNSGKTSFIVLFDKFINTHSFDFNDFSIDLRDEILNINEETDVEKITIRLILEIRYTEEDSLENISDLILDLEPKVNKVNLLFECSIKKKELVESVSKVTSRKHEHIKKFLRNFLSINIFAFNNESDLEKENRYKLVKKERKTVEKLINFQVIHAKRNVASSESAQNEKRVLSSLATAYYNRDNKATQDELNEINSSIFGMDGTLNEKYLEYFDDFLESAREFLNIKDLRVVSDLQSKEIIANHSKIVYGTSKNHLPEHLNGLGYMNILYLLLRIKIKKTNFIENKKDINLLFIEEPEAHTHPQMQYIFIDKIKNTLSKIDNLQTIISTHSAHILKKCDFEDIRYFLKNQKGNNITIQNFYSELEDKYRSENPKEDEAEKANFNFLKQYLTIGSSELFFAEKIIFIEGTTEKLLFPYFMNKFEKEQDEEVQSKEDEEKRKYTPLSSQNISILEVGANSKAFRHFINFLGIKTLIFTDIDTTEKVEKISKKDPSKTKIVYPACEVNKGTHTSNYSIKYFLDAPPIKQETNFSKWMVKMKNNELHSSSIIKVAYQIKDNGYHGRSFEDSFISINLDTIKKYRNEIIGLKNIDKLDEIKDYYILTKTILDGKSEFASSLLWLALSKNDVDWEIPLYIKEGLLWISK